MCVLSVTFDVSELRSVPGVGSSVMGIVEAVNGAGLVSRLSTTPCRIVCREDDVSCGEDVVDVACV